MVMFLNLNGLWFRSRCKNTHQKDFCLKEIGQCAQNVVSVLASIVNIIGGTYVTILITLRIFTLTLNKTFIQALKITRHMTMDMF